MPDADETGREPRGRVLFALFLAVGLIAFGYVWKTLHQRELARLSSSDGPVRAHTVITNWLEQGWFASCGMIFPTADAKVVYRWSTGAHLTSGFVLEKIWRALTGRYGWRLLALHNQFIALLGATLLALLAYRLARRCGVDPLHAFVLGIAAQMVQFTFPSNLALSWEMSPQAYSLLPAIAFLLLEERALDGRRTRMHTILQGIAIFALTCLEGLCSTMFIAAYLATVLLMRGERPPLRRLIGMLLLPWLAAYAIYGIQLSCAKGETLIGSSFQYRSGLDGDAMFYGDHLDIAFGRDLVRAGRSDTLFRWPALFFAGVAALLAILIAFARGRAPRIVALVLVTLAGEYVLYAAVFSQAVALHPYLFDALLVTPLILALFALAPALAEVSTQRTGLIVLLALFGAAWLSMFQLRLYAQSYPLAP